MPTLTVTTEIGAVGSSDLPRSPDSEGNDGSGFDLADLLKISSDLLGLAMVGF